MRVSRRFRSSASVFLLIRIIVIIIILFVLQETVLFFVFLSPRLPSSGTLLPSYIPFGDAGTAGDFVFSL